KAISGEANWYDDVGQSLKAHRDATSAHGATSSATANRLVIRDGSGRAKVAQGTSPGDAVVYPVPVTILKTAQGTMSSAVSVVFAVHQYAFASPLRGSRVPGTGGAYSVGIILGAQNYDQASTRQWAGMRLEQTAYAWSGIPTLNLQTGSP